MEYVIPGFLYVSVLAVITVREAILKKDFDDYVVAGRNKSTLLVTASMLATCLGASTTIGQAGMAWKNGFTAFWWLGAGALGLLLQSLFIAGKVRESGAYTLPEIIEKNIGIHASRLVSLIIVIAWPGIIAAQFVAAAKILSSMFAFDFSIMLICCAAVIILYALAGGQNSVMKTDLFQLGVLLTGIVALWVVLWRRGSGTLEFRLVDQGFQSFDLVYVLIIVGGSYFFGPDMCSRLLTGKSVRVVRRSAFFAAIVIGLFSVLITTLGMMARNAGIEPGSAGDIISMSASVLAPTWMYVLVGLALLSAVISSADTCLVTVSGIIEVNLLRGKRIVNARIWVLLTGLFALGVALFRTDIIRLLVSAYAIYTAGVVGPGVIALLAAKKNYRRELMMIPIAVGGLCGLASNFVSFSKELALTGCLVSTVLALLVVFFAGRSEVTA